MNLTTYQNDKRALVFDEDACKGCDVCAHVCPKNVLSLDSTRVNAKGYNPAVCTDIDNCIACGMCGTMCPDSVITIRLVGASTCSPPAWAGNQPMQPRRAI